MKLSQFRVFIVTGLIFLQGCAGVNPTASPSAKPAATVRKISATDNYYQYINHHWLEKTVIPANRAGINNFVTIQDTVHDRMKQLVLQLQDGGPQSVDQQKIAALYQSYNDLEHRNKQGIKPIQDELQKIAMLKSHRQVALMFASLQRQGITTPWVGFVDADYKDSNRNIVHLSQGGLSIDREYYVVDDARSVQQREFLHTALNQLLALAGYADADAMASNVIALESRLAAIQSSNIENRDVDRTYNMVSYQQLVASTAQLFTASQLAALGIPGDYPVNVMQPAYLQQLQQLFGDVELAVWRQYLAARVVLNYARLLSEDFTRVTTAYDIERGLYETRPPQWQLAIAYLNDNVGMLLGKLYVEAYFDDSIKIQVQAIKDSIKQEYRLAIAASDRLGPQTKQSALQKLDKMAYQIGYPDQWQDYSSLQLDRQDLVGNQQRIALYEHQRNIDKLGKPVDRSEWAVPPQEVNAFYNPGTNTFVLLAGILVEPFYSSNGDLAANYGGVGFVIGHEIGHGFDDQGSRFDGDGNLANWWSESDARQFDSIRLRLIEQANAYEILPGHWLNGELEIGEIIGDLSGAEIALRAFEKQAQKQEPGGRDEAMERFLAQLAITWRSKIRREVLLNQLQSDPHPPAEYRANGTVRNLDEYHEIYRTRAGDGMYLAPAERVNIWF